MTESFAEWLYALALIVPPAVVLLGALALLTPKAERKQREAALHRSHAHA